MTPEQIADAQRRLGLPVTCREDETLILAVRRFQMEHRLLVTGYLDERTYQLLWETKLLRTPVRPYGGSAGTEADSDISTHTGG